MGEREIEFPPGLKPNVFDARSGIAEAMPFQITFTRPVPGNAPYVPGCSFTLECERHVRAAVALELICMIEVGETRSQSRVRTDASVAS